ncbi:MAG: hypothetical protein H7A55_02175 [Verrucomicrobiaceae bacterium]|nr:hypothetical protein [Verrucomicrobiaceae bacterium]
MSEQSPSDDAVPLQFFDMENGEISSDEDQGAVDAFAADFQGLRHFGTKLGQAMNLKGAWMGAVQEADFAVLYRLDGPDVGSNATGAGARIGQQALLFELLGTINTEEA